MTTHVQTRSTPRERLYKEICKLRTRGLADPRDRLHELQGLLHIARSSSDRSTDHAKVKEVLEHATAQMGSVYGTSTAVLLGLHDSLGRKTPERRALALQAFHSAERLLLPPGDDTPGITIETFRTHIEPTMLNNLVTELIKIDNEEA